MALPEAILEEVPAPTSWPQGVGRVQPPRVDTGEDGSPQTLTIWQVYAHLTPLARRYLLTIAANPDLTPNVALYNAGSKAKNGKLLANTRKVWRKHYIGFAELEDKLWNEPIVAAHFIAVVALPKALAHYAGVLEEKKRGNASQAALHIVNVANFEGRTQAKKQTAPPDPNEPKTSDRLEGYIAGRA